ncbi:hypothetical protein [Tardiphaga robiniae]|uniref:DUF2232 domain-containing protein n=1 Tax=Tardiphaga robiniae TaxID=943830 RepID=A0A164A761_9BRAD|nr:hypothetical protein [Tardiphaga robiniae]KZD24353.1 hypothetical protein A4A58_23030 [Tardiphaga robiniae]
MIASLLIAFAAGAASALMFASIISGALISLLLFYLAPLPLMVAALGWGPVTAAIGGIAAGTSLGLLFGMPYLAAFVFTVALPAWWLGHLALLGRPVTAEVPGVNGAAATPPVVEWYPVGRILLWTAGFAAFTTMGALLTLGTDGDTIVSALRRALTRILGSRGGAGDSEQVINALVTIAPAAAAIVAIMTLTLNLWLAGRIIVTSGRLNRPWPELKSAALPPMTMVALCLAVALSFMGGLIGIFSQIFTSALMMAYALTGFAALHTLTMGMKSRVMVLGLTYAMVLVLGWPILTMVGLGLADAFFGFRQRFLARKPPSSTAA